MALNGDQVPHACPGTESEEAGKAAACAGCPNQSLCQTAPKGPDPDLPKIKEALQDVKHILLVLSGKGGVGKSTFSSHLAFSLASKNFQVGILDVDICGPSVPRILGVEGEQMRKTNLGMTPVYRDDNLAVVSAAFMVGPDDAVIWRGPKKNGLIKQFLRDVDWGELDYLIIDTPPGTSDEHISTVTALSMCSPDGAIIVTTPQDVAINDVRKEITFCRKVNLPILGIVENMAGFVCPKCTKPSDIFKAAGGGGAALCEQTKTVFLGSVPLDPLLARACDEGRDFLKEYPNSPATIAYNSIIDKITGGADNMDE